MTTETAAKLREPFPADLIGKLPRVTCRECSDKDKNCQQHNRRQCDGCRNYISTAHIHLDYVGHAAVTDRLLQVDPGWTWEPVALDQHGLPAFDPQRGLWIRLTVAGVTRLGYGDGKSVKECIGDAIRNAAMRFGVALDLWAKEDLRSDETPADPEPVPQAAREPQAGRPETQAAQDGQPTALDVQRQIRQAGERRGMGKEELAADFDAWTQGGSIRTADVSMLRGYLEYLAKLGEPAAAAS